MSRHRRNWNTPGSVGRLMQQRWPMPEILAQRPELMEPGRALHEWTELNDRGELCPTPDETIAGWAEAWKRFSYAFSPSFSHVEHVFETDQFHGIVDRAGSIRGKMSVLDLKTGKPATPQHGVQLAFYALGMFPNTAQTAQRLNVYLRKDGEFRLVVRDDPRDFVICRELLNQAYSEGETHGTARDS